MVPRIKTLIGAFAVAAIALIAWLFWHEVVALVPVASAVVREALMVALGFFKGLWLKLLSLWALKSLLIDFVAARFPRYALNKGIYALLSLLLPPWIRALYKRIQQQVRTAMLMALRSMGSHNRRLMRERRGLALSIAVTLLGLGLGAFYFGTIILFAVGAWVPKLALAIGWAVWELIGPWVSAIGWWIGGRIAASVLNFGAWRTLMKLLGAFLDWVTPAKFEARFRSARYRAFYRWLHHRNKTYRKVSNHRLGKPVATVVRLAHQRARRRPTNHKDAA